MPPCTLRWGFGLVCRLTMLMPSTTTRPSRTLVTVPRRPLSRPVVTTTSSPLRILFMTQLSKNFGSQRNDLHELRGAQLASHGSEDTGAHRLQLVGQQHRSVAVEADQRAVGATHTELGAHDHGVIDLALLHFAARDGITDADLDDIADR